MALLFSLTLEGRAVVHLYKRGLLTPAGKARIRGAIP